jgi:ubiquinone/menaquinone biosynthesis C-methylase UbiE
MAGMTDPEKDRSTLELALSFCSAGDRVLDLGCGYGRVTIPLSRAGCHVTGLDITPEMIRAAGDYAKAEGQKPRLLLGDMRELPFPSCSFDRVICFWSAFLHLLSRGEQLQACREMLRVLAAGGLAVVEMSNGETVGARDLLARSGHGPDGRIIEMPVVGITNTAYIHDKSTLQSIAQESGSRRSRVVFRNIGGRRRLTLWLWK